MLKTLSFLVFAIAILSSCKKAWNDTPIEQPKCKIISVNNSTGRHVFKYNNLGNPISALKGSASTGNPEIYFFYDKYNRILDLVGAYNIALDTNGEALTCFYEWWTRYAYADNNPSSLPVGDSTRIIGGYNRGVFAGPYANTPDITKYSYDEKGRINQKFSITYRVLREYNYDSRGNLIDQNKVYDSNPNYRGGNKTLMIVDANYSVNNPFIATTYNAQGFPLTVSAPSGSPNHDNFLHRGVIFHDFVYDCSAPGKLN